MSIDAEAARALPGVVAVWTFADVADIPPIDFRLTRMEGLTPYRQPILARDRDPELAAVDPRSIDSPQAAEDICERIAATGALEESRSRAMAMVGNPDGPHAAIQPSVGFDLGF